MIPRGSRARGVSGSSSHLARSLVVHARRVCFGAAGMDPRGLALLQFEAGGEEQEQGSGALGGQVFAASQPPHEGPSRSRVLEDGAEIDRHELVAEFPEPFDGIGRIWAP